MDQNLLNQITNLDIAPLFEGGSNKTVVEQSQNAPIYKVPGMERESLNLLELLSKPQKLENITVDSTTSPLLFASILIKANFFDYHPWAEAFKSIFYSVLFDVKFRIYIPGHQFCIGYFGIAYDPHRNEFSNDVPGTLLSNPVVSRSIEAFNYISSLDGLFINPSESSQEKEFTVSLPRSTAYNNYATTTFGSQSYGSIVFVKISPLKFSMDITNIELSVFAELTNVRMTPWRL